MSMSSKLGLLIDFASTALVVAFITNNVADDQVNFIEIDKVSDRINENSTYADIINYAQKPTLDIRNRMTCAHETTHAINTDLRNRFNTGTPLNAFYLPTGWAFVTHEPNIRKIQAAKFIPANVQGYRYNTYVTGAREWDEQPLYIVDEWCAYINGALVGIDDIKKGRYRGGRTDGVSGCLELALYSIGLCMAIEKYDNKYWNENKQFRLFMKWNLQRAYNTYMAGKDYPEFKWKTQEEFLHRFRTSKKTKRMRDFVTKYFDGIGLK
jgi:hypothetical protein